MKMLPFIYGRDHKELAQKWLKRDIFYYLKLFLLFSFQ